MRRLLLVRGDLAAGKSFFADILSQRYGANVFHKDSLKEVLGDTIGFTNREENQKLSRAAIELMRFLFAESAKLDKDLILESNFHKEEMERLYELAAKSQYEVLILELRGEPEILHKRFLNRIAKENRHPVHLTVKLDKFEDIKRCIESARAEEICGDVLEINADDFSYQTDAMVLARIDEFMGL